MRRREQPSLIACVLQDSRSLDRDSPFAVSACHMYGLEFVLRVSEVSSETAHLIDVGFLPRAELAEHVLVEDSL